MLKSTDTDAYKMLRELLIAARVDARLTQAQVAAKLGRPQSFISKYESGERGLDVIAFIQVCNALGVEPGQTISGISRISGRRTSRTRG